MAGMNGHKAPLLLSGMLTGQHALDKGSVERLAWHIRWLRTQLAGA